ncbi:MAG: hypothetical protein IJB96_10450 [Lachnospira sp.]|nr:hypothetical protein [Lachnospira sp.]
MKKVLFIIWQCTWGFYQTLIGAIIFLRLIRRKHYMYHGAIVTYWNIEVSVSLGLFIFVTEGRREPRRQMIVVHEYGHCIQSLILGPFYLLFIGLPSMLWCQLKVFERLRKKKNMSYYDMGIEKSASNLGERFTGEVAER